jgi:hypothetical protein
MRKPTLPVIFLGMTLSVTLAICQTTGAPAPPANVNDGSPYGGVDGIPSALMLGPLTGNPVCGTRTSPDPCVLTGQYDRYRTSANVHEPTLANFNSTSAASFGLKQFYQLPSNVLPSNYLFEPVIAQPLYITNVPPNNTNLLLVASLADYVYAFDTSSTAQTVAPLWSVNLATTATGGNHCTSTGVPFTNQHGNPGGAHLLYYGIVSTPVIDASPNPPIATPNHPVAYVVSACATLPTSNPSWFLDAIDLVTGTSVSTVPIQDSNFNGAYQLSRASLLMTHPANGGNYVYVAFGAGGLEVGAEYGSGRRYSGVLFGYSIGYSANPETVTFTQMSPTFYTSGNASPPADVFPSPVFTAFGPGYTGGGPGGRPNCTIGGTQNNCSPGTNWGVNGGGLWGSSRQPSSDGAGNVYVAAGNGPFACTLPGSPQQCTVAANVRYWGESAMAFPAPTTGAPLTLSSPADFFAPFQQRYACPPGSPSCTAYLLPTTTDPAPAANQTGELSRLDLDFGVCGIVGMAHTGGVYPFFMTCDKSGLLYPLPPPSTVAPGSTLGEFQGGDVGLTGGTYTTQAPFPLTRLPSGSCPTIDANGAIGGSPCDEVHELAWFNDLLAVWPSAESVEIFQGTLNTNGTGYTFGSTPAFDPCVASSQNSCNGTLAAPPFPPSSSASAGAAMAFAADNSVNPPPATLWAIVPRANSAGAGEWGELYAYGVTFQNGSNPASLSYLWDSVSQQHCSNPPATGWFATSFTEPTVATGAAYVPTTCVTTSTTSYNACVNVPQGSVSSGVLRFAACQ